MSELLIRSLSQGLQAILPVAAWLVCVRRMGSHRLAAAIRMGLLAALPATIVAADRFRHTDHQAAWEALLAVAATALAVWLGLALRRGAPDNGSAALLPRLDTPLYVCIALAAATALILVRQTMEIGAVLMTAFELRSIEAVEAIFGGAAIAVLAAAASVRLAQRLSVPLSRIATDAVLLLFAAQTAFYAVHELAEARWLPESELVHAATEPYGPDGIYGQYVSLLLIAVPLAAVCLARVRIGVRGRVMSLQARLAPVRRLTARAAVPFGVAGVVTIVALNAATSPSKNIVTAEAAKDIARIVARPHLLFRHTGSGPHYGLLSVAPLDPPGAGRVAAGVACDRVAFASGSGICLQVDRRFFAGYKAVLFDRALRPRHSFKLDGSPSRTRVSSDGRVGGITVFVTGHNYAAGSFSTQTLVIDMASGDAIGDLEQFSAWRGEGRIKSSDVNFWGVTFARDSNVFYATLATAGTSNLVRGDLGLRKLSVLRGNLECPSLSPDNRLVAFKKRVGAAGAWRLHVLELATMTEREIAGETRYVDDQVEWLDDAHILYAIRRPGSAVTDVWVSAIDGRTAPHVFLSEAESPAVVR